ncbi:vegetative cell wall protein gp1 [Zea mays]|uniref:vegetative cell wall protein gp1 n=1 Tax=Zea mays TaxID=4577 RepID=UPI001652A7FD|nr:vegetative cell wall protein gp1 [Zea mays]
MSRARASTKPHCAPARARLPPCIPPARVFLPCISPASTPPPTPLPPARVFLPCIPPATRRQMAGSADAPPPTPPSTSPPGTPPHTKPRPLPSPSALMAEMAGSADALPPTPSPSSPPGIPPHTKPRPLPSSSPSTAPSWKARYADAPHSLPGSDDNHDAPSLPQSTAIKRMDRVRSFGTEGRKKDGVQIPASDKVYEYILFWGTDIKSSPPQPSPPQAASLHNDPAIIQSHYSQPASTSSSLPSTGGAVLPDFSSQAVQYGLQRPNFQSNLPLYQPGNTPWGSLVAPPAGNAPWGSSVAPPAGNASTLLVPSMYWQGYYAPSSGLPHHLQPPPLLHPTPGLSVPQNLQYPGLNPSLQSGPQKLSELQPSLMQH